MEEEISAFQMDLSTVKVILALAASWGVPAAHGDILNAYVKAHKKPYLRIFLQLPRGMRVSEETLRAHDATSACWSCIRAITD